MGEVLGRLAGRQNDRMLADALLFEAGAQRRQMISSRRTASIPATRAEYGLFG